MGTSMQYRPLGRTGITVSPYALGTMMFGAVGNPDHDECVRMVHVALAHGINLVDTADMYSSGESEAIVGKALQGKRDDVILATKGHFALEEGLNRSGNSRRYLTRAVEASLDRLGTDYIDLYQVHRPDWTTDLEETLAVLTDLVRAGKIRAFGLSAFPAHEIVEAHRVAETRGLMRPRTEQPPYNLLARGVERDVFRVTQRWGMGVLTWSPLGFGFLTGRHRRGSTPSASGRPALRPEWFDPADATVDRKLAAVEELCGVTDDLGCSLPELAVAFPLTHPAVTAVILGPRTMPQLEASLAGATLELDDDVLDRIDEIVPPGTDVYAPNAAFDVPWLSDPAQRRRRGPRAAALDPEMTLA
jgi:aryl-alcohol dehydrogenase-like predicted oxidoreductase